MDGQRFHIEPVLQFRSKSIVAYNYIHRESSSCKGSDLFMANAAKLKGREKYTGKITPGAKKRLQKAISLLVQIAGREWIYNPVTKKHQEHRLSFITLTLPDVEKAKDAKFTHKHLLEPFLRYMRRKHGMKSYVWKAELQKNESVHYHITTPTFVPYYEIRDYWNRLTRKHGMLESFKEKYGHDNPNSIDIHGVYKAQDMEAYLIKYVSKEYQNEKGLSGKVWDCSMNLKKGSYFTTSEDTALQKQISDDIQKGFATAFYTDHCTVIKYRHDDYYLSFSQEVINNYYSHLNLIRTCQHLSHQSILKSTTASGKLSDHTETRKDSCRKERKNVSSASYGKQLQIYQTFTQEWNLQTSSKKPAKTKGFDPPGLSLGAFPGQASSLP